MNFTKKLSNLRVLCVVVAIFCLLLGLLSGLSLNTTSHDVLASYRSSVETARNNNVFLSELVKDECARVLKTKASDTLICRKVALLALSEDSLQQYLDNLRTEFIQNVNREEGETLLRLDDVDYSTNFMIYQGNAAKLRAQIERYQDQLLQLIDDQELRERVAQDISFHTNQMAWQYGKASWEEHYFDHAMAVEVVNQLEQIQQQAHLAAIRVLRAIEGNGGDCNVSE